MDCEKIINGLKSHGFKLNENYENTHLTFFKVIDGIDFIYLVVCGHEGNGNRIMFRGDVLETHDRWSNCDYQRFYKDEDDLLENWNKIWIFDEQECN